MDQDLVDRFQTQPPLWFYPSDAPRMEVATVAAYLRYAKEDLAKVFELPCPACEVQFSPADLVKHLERPPWWCDRVMWGHYTEPNRPAVVDSVVVVDWSVEVVDLPPKT